MELDGDCLFIVSDVGSGRYVALWPPQYRLVQVKPVAITPGDGTAPLVEGTHVRFGGGELDSIEQADILAGLLDGAAPPECGSTKYWVVMGYELP